MGTSKLCGVVLPGAFAAAVLFSAAMPANGALIAEYNFEEGSGTTAFDSSGYTSLSNGTLTEAGNDTLPAYTTKAAVGTYALSFTGSVNGTNFTNYVAFPNSVAKFGITGALSLSADVDLTSVTANPNGQDIVSRSGFSGNRGYQLQVSATGHITMQIAPSTTTTLAAVGATVIPANTYELITGVYDPTGASDNGVPGVYVYLNGVLDGSNTTSIPATEVNSTTNFNIGTQGVEPSNTSTGGVTGLIDDVRVYNNALSATDVSNLVPEPASIGILVIGAAGVISRRRRA